MKKSLKLSLEKMQDFTVKTALPVTDAIVNIFTQP